MLRSKLPELCGIGALFRWLCVRLAVLGESIPRPGKQQFKRFFLWPGRNGACDGRLTGHARQAYVC